MLARLCSAAALLVCAEAVAPSASCASLAGRWYDEASDDAMALTESNCQLSTKYGKAMLSGTAVAPMGGLMSALQMTGEYHAATQSIRWSNGVEWRKLSGAQASGGVDARVSTLEKVVAELRAQVNAVAANCSTGCSKVPATGEMQELKARVDTLNATVVGLHPPKAPATPATPAPATPATPSPPATPKPSEITALQARIDALNASIAGATTGKPGRDGYCTMTPNATWVYMPVTRYMRRQYMKGADACMTSGQAMPGAAVPYVTDVGCSWMDETWQEPIPAYKGDNVVFWRAGEGFGNVYLMKDKAAYDACDFTTATLLAASADFNALEAQKKNFTYTLDKAGTYYFAASREGVKGVDQKLYCWNPRTQGAHPGKPAKWGSGTKSTVVALDPTREVMAQCPLYDPSKFGAGASGGGKQVDSASVERLKGAVGAITRQLIHNEMRTQDTARTLGNAGVTVVRSRQHGTDAYFQEGYVGEAPMAMHGHANTQITVGMGEFGAVLNGVHFKTRHNDYSLLQPDETLPVDKYTSSWPPPSRLLDFPPVPPSVKGTVDEQIKEMREYFRAWQNEDTSIRADYAKYFQANLCYLEGTWAEEQETIAEPFKSERHHIDAESWEDLNDKLQFLFNNGQKQNLENLPFLPTSFRGVRESKSGDVFEPRIGQWFYRINCVPLKEKVSKKRFRVRSDLHVQVSEAEPKTRASLANTERALFEMDPTPRENFKGDAPWPKSKWQFDFLDQLMEHVPGMDGPRGYMEDYSFGPMCANYNQSGKLNTARYSRYFAMVEKDAMGDTIRKRGFNDLLFAAQTSHPKVSPIHACKSFNGEEKGLGWAAPEDIQRETVCGAAQDKFSCGKLPQWDKKQMSRGASGAKCVWDVRDNVCMYKKCWTQRWSYAIPLEIVYTTPLYKWNPYNIGHYKRGTPEYNAVTANGADGATKHTPLKGSSMDHYFRTPAKFFKDRKKDDIQSGDTSGGMTYVQNLAGEVVEVRASGTWIMFPDIEGVGEVRQRYPIMPVYEEGTSAWKEVKAVQELIMGANSQKIKDIIAETRSAAYGAELRLMAGQGHEHRVSLTPAEVHSFKTGKVTTMEKLSSTAVGHAHYVELKYDAKRGVGKEYTMSWCTTKSLPNDEVCPANVLSQPGGCGKTAGGQQCCHKKCPDNHPGVEIVI